MTGLDLNQTFTRAMTCSRDKSVRVYETEKKGRCIKILSFAQSIAHPNMQFRGALYFGETLYTLAMNTKGPTVIVKWDARGDKYIPLKNEVVHPRAASCLNINADGSALAVGSGDGFVVGVSASSLLPYVSQKQHRAPVTSISFTHSQASILSSSNDRTNYAFTANKGSMSMISIVYWFSLLGLILLYLLT